MFPRTLTLTLLAIGFLSLVAPGDQPPQPLLVVPEPPPFTAEEALELGGRLGRDIDRLTFVMNRRDESGAPLTESYRAAHILARIGCRTAIPFLIAHINHTRPASGFSLDFVCEHHPCLNDLAEEFGATGAEKMIGWVASQSEREPRVTDCNIELLSYGVLMQCGFDQEGREFALRWIDHVERRSRETGSLNRLREQLAITERTCR